MDEITIPWTEYQELKKDQLKLSCLENAGVDNWEWYEQALEDGGYYE